MIQAAGELRPAEHADIRSAVEPPGIAEADPLFPDSVADSPDQRPDLGRNNPVPVAVETQERSLRVVFQDRPFWWLAAGPAMGIPRDWQVFPADEQPMLIGLKTRCHPDTPKLVAVRAYRCHAMGFPGPALTERLGERTVARLQQVPPDLYSQQAHTHQRTVVHATLD